MYTSNIDVCSQEDLSRIPLHRTWRVRSDGKSRFRQIWVVYLLFSVILPRDTFLALQGRVHSLKI